jgi:hypothetical protein
MNKFITYLFVGTFASVAFIIIILYVYLMGGLAVSKLYEWFIMPLSPNLPKITYVMGIGIMMFASLFSRPGKEFKKDIVDDNKTAIFFLLKYPSALLFGYILHLIIN